MCGVLTILIPGHQITKMSQCTCFVLIITSSAKCNWHSSYIEISESSRARLAPHNIMILHACVMTLKNFFLLHVLIIKLIGIAEGLLSKSTTNINNLMINNYQQIIHSGAVILLPSGQAPVCHSEQLQLICNTTELYRYLRWSYSVYNEQGVLTDYTRTVSSIDASQQSSHIVVNSTSFNFLRISGQGVPPITTMTINSVGNSLNGITVGCTGMGNLEMMTARTTISIINETYQGWLSYSFYWL